MNNVNHLMENFSEKKISRKEAIKKAGVTALTTASLVFLATKTKAAGSPASNEMDNPGSARPNRQ